MAIASVGVSYVMSCIGLPGGEGGSKKEQLMDGKHDNNIQPHKKRKGKSGRANGVKCDVKILPNLRATERIENIDFLFKIMPLLSIVFPSFSTTYFVLRQTSIGLKYTKTRRS